MADTAVAITAGSGTNIDTRTEATNGNHRQVVVLGDPSTNAGVAAVDATAGLKVDLGADNDVTVTSGSITATQGTATNLKTQAEAYQGGSAVAAGNPLQVTLANGTVPSHAVTNAGTFAVQVDGSALTSLQLIDDVVFVDDTATHATGTTKGVGVMAVATPTDAAVDANDIGMVAMTTSRQLKVDASGVAVPVTDNSGSLTVDYATTGSGTATGALRVELPTNGTGVIATLGTITNVVHVDDNSSSLSVDWAGTAPVTGSGTATGALRVELANNGTGLVGLNAGTNAIGKLAANSGVDIGDVDITSVVPGTGATNSGKAEDAAHTSGDVGTMALGVRTDVPNAVGAGTTGDYSFLATDMVGGVRTALYETDFAVLGTNHVKKYYANTGAVTDGIVWSPAAGKRWYVTDLIFTTSAAATVTFEDDKAGGDETVLAMDCAANSGVAHHFATPLFSGEDAADLIVTTSAGNIKVTVVGYEI